MALIPLNQEVTVTRSEPDTGGWGGGGESVTVTHRVRVDEKLQKVENQLGDEVLSTAEIMFDKLADVEYSDTIKYVDERGREIERQPKLIEPIRMINGRAALTVVYL